MECEERGRKKRRETHLCRRPMIHAEYAPPCQRIPRVCPLNNEPQRSGKCVEGSGKEVVAGVFEEGFGEALEAYSLVDVV
jgi:hypothetical protein